MFNVTTVCPLCGETHVVSVIPEDYADWKNGKLIQDAMPYLSAEERELLISGICIDCWDKMFKED